MVNIPLQVMESKGETLLKLIMIRIKIELWYGRITIGFPVHLFQNADERPVVVTKARGNLGKQF